MPGEVLDAGFPDGVRGIFTTCSTGVVPGLAARLQRMVESSAPNGGRRVQHAIDGHVSDLATRVGDFSPTRGRWRRGKIDRAILAHNDGAAIAALGVSAERLVRAEQVHGTGVAVCSLLSQDGGYSGIRGVDALVSPASGIALLIRAADCMPVLLADVDAAVIGAVHAGRQGLLAGVLQKTVATMVGQGAEPGRITAVVGPSICGRCYELPAAMVGELDARLPGVAAATSWNTPSVDLRTGAGLALAEVGVRNVRHVGGCTYEQPERFFSYRRDGTGARHAGVVALGDRRDEPLPAWT